MSAEILPAIQRPRHRGDWSAHPTAEYPALLTTNEPAQGGSAALRKAFLFPATTYRDQNPILAEWLQLWRHIQSRLHVQSRAANRCTARAPFRGPHPLQPCGARVHAFHVRSAASAQKLPTLLRARWSRAQNEYAARAVRGALLVLGLRHLCLLFLHR